MGKLMERVDRYLQCCDWKDISLLKFCVCAAGVLLGLAVPARKKRPAVWIAMLVFVATYIPLMMKFLPFLWVEEDADGPDSL